MPHCAVTQCEQHTFSKLGKSPHIFASFDVLQLRKTSRCYHVGGHVGGRGEVSVRGRRPPSSPHGGHVAGRVRFPCAGAPLGAAAGAVVVVRRRMLRLTPYEIQEEVVTGCADRVRVDGWLLLLRRWSVVFAAQTESESISPHAK